MMFYVLAGFRVTLNKNGYISRLLFLQFFFLLIYPVLLLLFHLESLSRDVYACDKNQNACIHETGKVKTKGAYQLVVYTYLSVRDVTNTN